ncbi:hypothetical protein C7H84_26095 [Burkholderia sp. Nafp2/4-1b]|uniref:hypothetical protein n=1 Tax=Burkholderia sp. Nafp2/4-1b TaxID=2116686 RepID=UPI000EF96975|nr:hypothetical protein [Burkholderia sp. Nafp2/4-1b]RKU00565.1 hypothetical protein C7H84_26095 [Burkholderia sp. Nafp2/4-1b]
MNFKATYTLQKFRLRSSSLETFVIDDDVPVTMILRRPTEEELSHGFEQDVTFCEAYAHIAPNDKTLKVFNDIESGAVRGTPEEYTIGYKDSSGEMVYLPKQLPNYLTDFIARTSQVLSRAVNRLVNLVRWRTDAYGSHRVLATKGIGGLEWSRDTKHWYPAPTGFSVHFEQVHIERTVGAAEKQEISALLQEKADAPLHHEMFREAWHQRLANPRSAIIMGMASLEIAVKYCIGKLVPNAQWLAENVPSPPVILILKEMLPTLPAVCSLPVGAVMLPDQIERKLKNGVSIRNSLAHAGKFTLQIDSLEEILNSVKDILWLVDFLCGQVWAYNYIRKGTREAMEANIASTASLHADNTGGE